MRKVIVPVGQEICTGLEGVEAVVQRPKRVPAARFNRTKINDPSRTRQAFQAMFEAHQPDLWVFGHWHHSFDGVLDGTRFVCLNELEARTFDFDLPVREVAPASGRSADHG